MKGSSLVSLQTAVPAVIAAIGLALPANCQKLTVIPPSESVRQVHVLTHGIKWYTSLEEAEAAARQQKKLIFWIHMLGQIDGKT